MPNPYREIFKVAGAKGFAAAGFIARLPVAMATIGIVAMLSQTHGEYWLAGAVSATFALTNAFVSPQVSWLVDRYGQRPVLIPATTLSVAAFAVLIIATHYDWPIWTLFASALLAAAMPSMPAMVRARWTELYRDTPKLNTAFAFESVADELVYMAGSSLAVGLSVALFPEAGPLAFDHLPCGGVCGVRHANSNGAQGAAGRKNRRPFGHRPAAGPDPDLRARRDRYHLRRRGGYCHRHGE